MGLVYPCSCYPVLTLLVAAILRYNMPESAEFTMNQEELNEETGQEIWVA